MDGVAMPANVAEQKERRKVRCRCLSCGAHAQAVVGMRLYGQCGNCGGIELVPLDPATFH